LGMPVLGMILAALGYIVVWNGWQWFARRHTTIN